VAIREGATAAALQAAGGRVTGVTLESGEALEADLVVDASGRGARAPGWLEALGHGAPPETVVKANLGYTSALFRLQKEPDWKLLIMACPPVSFRNGLIGAVEGDRWVVSLTGLFGDHAPTDREGFLQFAASLPEPDVADALAGAELLSPIAVHKIPSQVRRHYERMASFPDGLIVLGDAACCLSPAFAQGMTVAALEAQLLGETLAAQAPGSLAGFSRRFQQQLAKLVDGPWQAATGDDLQYKQTEGVRPPGLGLINWYMGRVVRLSARDPYVQLRFLQVMHMLAPGPSLFEPRILWRVLTAR
jgi:2-polyprenyl-6-methoxyphenol hydroxylase-like FAD-dependent oxidoreductase